MTLILESQLYRAGAGAGKTTILTKTIEEYAFEFKKSHGRFPNFIVTTFTRKATQELRERLLLNAIKKNDPSYLEFAGSSQNILISTIHGVLHTFLNRHGHNFGFDPNFKIINSLQERKIELLALKELMCEDSKASLLADIYPLKVLVEILHEGTSALSQYPQLTPFRFPELQKRLEEKLENLRLLAERTQERVQAETTAEAWLNYSRLLVSAVAALLEQDRERARNLLMGSRKPSFTSKSRVSVIVDADLRDIRKRIDDFLDVSYSPELWKKHVGISEKFADLCVKFHQKVTEHKRRDGLLTIADLELRTVESLRLHPEAARAFSKEWDYWFVDEYQDTSPLQEEILNLLQAQSPCFVVGDPQQSIYLFRGARSEVFLRKEAHYKSEDKQVSTLEHNYRSRKELVHFFNDYFLALGKNFLSMKPKVNSDSDLRPVTILVTKSEQEEYKQISLWVRNLMSKGVPAEQICVLSKTNSILKKVADELKEHEIPHCLHVSGGFGKRREIQDALSLLKFIVNPYDNYNLLCLLRTPYFQVRDDKLESMRSLGRTLWLEILKEGGALAQLLLEIHQKADVCGIYLAFVEGLSRFGFFEAANHCDGSGVREANLCKLIQALKTSQKNPNFSYLTFIDEFGQASSENSDSDALPAVEPSRVNLMTIHASKGLQFQHVIIPGFGKGQRQLNRKLFLVDEQRQKFVMAIPNDEGANEYLYPGKDISLHFYERELEESDRLLYVAFTRAIESLFVSGQSEFEKFSWMQSCPFDLSAGVHEREEYSYEVLNEIVANEMAPPTSTRSPLKKLKIKADVVHRKVSVTSLLSKKANGAPVNVIESVDRIRTGIELHNIFEGLAGHFDDKKLKDHLSSVPAQYHGAIEYAFRQRDLPLKNILQVGQPEYGFIFKFDNFRIEGKIDLWGLLDQELWIVDYKTGSVAGKDRAIQQLKIYSLALMEMLNLEKAKMAVIFPFEEKTWIEEITKDDGLVTELRQLLQEI